MPSRMDRYYDSGCTTKNRTSRNQELYKTIYDDVEYSNVEGISIIEKNENIDIGKIKELINSTNDTKKRIIEQKKETFNPVIEDYEERNYDINEVLTKAKTERTEEEKNTTQYDILKGINLNSNLKVPQSLSDEELKNMIESITNNSKINQTGDLLDDLKTIHTQSITQAIDEQCEKDNTVNLNNIDKSFYTSSLGFTSNDFDDLKEIKNDIKKNSLLTKILLFVLLVILVVGIMFVVYNFIK